MADQEAGGEQRDRAEQGGNGVALIEEFDRQDCRQAPENIKVVPLDDVSSGRGSDDASEVCWNAISHGVSSPTVCRGCLIEAAFWSVVTSLSGGSGRMATARSEERRVGKECRS